MAKETELAIGIFFLCFIFYCRTWRIFKPWRLRVIYFRLNQTKSWFTVYRGCVLNCQIKVTP